MSSTLSLSFQRAELTHVPAVVTLVESAYRGEASRAGWTTEADLLDGQRTDTEGVTTLLTEGRSRIELAYLGAELVGSVLVQAEPAPYAHIGMFAVRPTLQGRGVGALLLAHAEHVARTALERSVAKMTVIEQRTELIAWYARRGYAPTGATEPFPYGDARFGLPKRDDLRFVVLAKRLA